MDVIYKITNTYMSKSYVGSKKDWNAGYLGSPNCKPTNQKWEVQQEWKKQAKHNKSNFIVEFLESFDLISHADLLEKELMWQKKLDVVHSCNYINAGYATYKGGGHSSHKKSETHKENIRNAKKGKVGMRKEGKTIYVNKDTIDEHIKNGWELGIVKRTFSDNAKNNIRNSVIGRIAMNNGEVEIRIYEKSVSYYLQKGYIRGRLKTTCEKLKRPKNKTIIKRLTENE